MKNGKQWGASVREALTRSRALTSAHRLDFAERRLRLRALRLSQQRASAAVRLWNTGHAQEGLRLQRDALRVALSLPHAPDELYAVGGAKRDLRRVQRGEKSLQQTLGPLETSRHMRQLFADAHVAQRTLVRLHEPVLLGVHAIRRRQNLRVTAFVLTVFGVAAAALYLRPPPPQPLVSSGSFASGNYPDTHAFDGDVQTEWLLPDRARGFIERRFSVPRGVRDVRLMNGHNPPHNDRAVRSARVSVYSGTELVASEEVNFPVLDRSPEWRVVRIEGEAIDRVRVDINSFHRFGAALAEVEIGPFRDESEDERPRPDAGSEAPAVLRANENGDGPEPQGDGEGSNESDSGDGESEDTGESEESESQDRESEDDGEPEGD